MFFQIIIMLISILFYSLIFFSVQKIRSHYIKKQSPQNTVSSKKSPKETLQSLHKSLLHETHPQSLKDQLHLIVRSLKDYLIELLDLDPEIVESSTQQESLGHIKIGLQNKGLYDSALVQSLESFFHEAEVYRFSQRTPDITLRDRALKLIDSLLQLKTTTRKSP